MIRRDISSMMLYNIRSNSSDSTRSNTLELELNLEKSIDKENETLETNKISKTILIDDSLEDE